MPKPPLRTSFLLALTVLFAGCYSVHLKSVVPDGHGGTDPVNEGPHYEAQSRTVVSWLWGLAQPSDIDEQRCNGNGFAHVRARTNLGFSLISVVTLGIVMPQQIEWWCATDRQAGLDPRS
jgi:hypothetical protein